jgi:hypothetical protein
VWTLCLHSLPLSQRDSSQRVKNPGSEYQISGFQVSVFRFQILPFEFLFLTPFYQESH